MYVVVRLSIVHAWPVMLSKPNRSTGSTLAGRGILPHRVMYTTKYSCAKNPSCDFIKTHIEPSEIARK